jgi:hypothetical protein
MSLQKFELGQKVWAFKQQGDTLKKAFGIIQSAEIDDSGFIFYKVSLLVQTKDGIQVTSITANHASIALSEEEIDKMIQTYHEFQEEQKKQFETIFGGSEFPRDYIEKELTKGGK